jgi:hypothetical protein
MSQDDGSKKDSSQIAQEEAKSWMKDRMENDSKGSEDNPPQSDYQYIPPHRGFNWSGCFITAAIIIVVILVILGITCFALSYSSN